MTWLASFAVGILTAILGSFGAFELGQSCVKWYRISHRGGGSDIFPILLALVGGAFGLLVGVVSARIVAGGGTSFGRSLVVAAGSMAAMLLIITAVCRFAADLPTTVQGHPAELQAEVRCPPGFSIRADAFPEHWDAHIDTRARGVTSRSPVRVNEARQENGRWILPVTLAIDTRARGKLLYVSLGQESGEQLFTPQFSAPIEPRLQIWSDWLESVVEPGQIPSPAFNGFQLRFRIAAAPPPAPMPVSIISPTKAELEARVNAQEDATFGALTAESPLEDLLRFARYSEPERRRQRAGEMLGRRPDIVAEMSAQIMSTDADTALAAIRALAFIKPLPREMAAPVAQRGEQIIAALEQLTVGTPTPANAEQAAEVGRMFNAWSEGPYALHEYAGVDGSPQLRRIIQLADERPGSEALSQMAAQARALIRGWSQVP